MSLPIMTSGADVEAIVAYLRNKPTGVTQTEAKAAIEGRLLDGRKLAAYEQLGFIFRTGDQINLTPLGREFSRASDDEKQLIFRQIAKNIRAYNLALEWAYHSKFDQIASVDLVAHWLEHCSEDLETDQDRTIRVQVSCFFSLAQAAGFGEHIVGRRGQETRLVLNRETLREYIEIDKEVEKQEPQRELPPGEDAVVDREPRQKPPSPEPQQAPRVFIAHSKNEEILGQVKDLLKVADLQYEVAVEVETTAIPVPLKVLDLMLNCSAAVICVTADETEDIEASAEAEYSINENVLIEIGASFVLYEQRVVLVWDRRLPIPSNLDGLYRCEFEGDELSYTVAMKLLKAVGNFRRMQLPDHDADEEIEA